MTRLSLAFIFFWIFLWVSFGQSFTVVLDAGHGGKDPGKVSKGYREKDIVLRVVLQTGKLLESKGIKVLYTRTKDVFVDLHKRGEIANKAKADLFVSVHCNAHKSEALGAETFVLGLHANKQNFDIAKSENEVIYLEDDYREKYVNYDINSPESIIGVTIAQEEYLEQSVYLATLIQNQFTANLKRKNRGVKQAGFIVLHGTVMPSVLVELGFITHPKERLFLKSDRGQKNLSNSLYNAVIAYKKHLEENQPSFRGKQSVGEMVKKIEKQFSDKINNSSSAKKENNKTEILYSVQLMTLSKKIPTSEYLFKGLDVHIEPYKNMYRYLFGNTTSYQMAKKLRMEAIKRGMQACYIVAYKNGKRISIKQALELQK